MSLTYASYVTDIANLMVVSPTDTNYLTVLPNIIDDAEQRIYRELDFLNTVTVFSSISLSSDTRDVTLPSSVVCVVVESINVLASPPPPVRSQLTPVSKEWLNIVYPTATSSSSTAVPLYFAMVTDQTLIVGPPPGQTCNLEITATIRPTALSSSNTTTYLSDKLPDLFMAASMVFANGYLKNFAATADDPQAPVTWEKVYQSRKISAMEEEARKKFGSQGWTSKQPNPVATPPRT
jgi:hypothetical protein